MVRFADQAGFVNSSSGGIRHVSVKVLLILNRVSKLTGEPGSYGKRKNSASDLRRALFIVIPSSEIDCLYGFPKM